MRGLGGASLGGVARLRRATAWVVFASLVALSSGQPFHPGNAMGVRDAVANAASQATLDAASAPGARAHLAGACSICRAIAQTRLGLRGPTIAERERGDGTGLPVVRGAHRTAPAAPWLASASPRAPPLVLPSQRS